MPDCWLAMAAVPAALVPVSFPMTRFKFVPAPLISIPFPQLPDATLPAPAAVPPIVLFVGPVSTSMPSPWLASD